MVQQGPGVHKDSPGPRVPEETEEVLGLQAELGLLVVKARKVSQVRLGPLVEQEALVVKGPKASLVQQDLKVEVVQQVHQAAQEQQVEMVAQEMMVAQVHREEQEQRVQVVQEVSLDQLGPGASLEDQVFKDLKALLAPLDQADPLEQLA